MIARGTKTIKVWKKNSKPSLFWYKHKAKYPLQENTDPPQKFSQEENSLKFYFSRLESTYILNPIDQQSHPVQRKVISSLRTAQMLIFFDNKSSSDMKFPCRTWQRIGFYLNVFWPVLTIWIETYILVIKLCF